MAALQILQSLQNWTCYQWKTLPYWKRPLLWNLSSRPYPHFSLLMWDSYVHLMTFWEIPFWIHLRHKADLRIQTRPFTQTPKPLPRRFSSLHTQEVRYRNQQAWASLRARKHNALLYQHAIRLPSWPHSPQRWCPFQISYSGATTTICVGWTRCSSLWSIARAWESANLKNSFLSCLSGSWSNSMTLFPLLFKSIRNLAEVSFKLLGHITSGVTGSPNSLVLPFCVSELACEQNVHDICSVQPVQWLTTKNICLLFLETVNLQLLKDRQVPQLSEMSFFSRQVDAIKTTCL